MRTRIKAAIGCFIFLTSVYHGSADVSHLAGGNTSPGFKHSSGGDVPVIDDLNSRSFGQQNWNIRNNIPGEPDVDYPIYGVPPITSFSCKDRHYGYYADVEARCQVFRVCANTDLTGKGFAFLCPNGTLFNQKFFVCDWYKNVDCFASESFFSRNEVFGTKMGLMSQDDMMSMVQGMVDYTKQPQFNNQPINNNGGFPFTSAGFPKQFGSNQGLINQNNGLASLGNTGSNNNGQQRGNGVSNQGRVNNVPQRGSEILSQPIFPSENNRFTPSTQSKEPSGSVPNGNSGSNQFNRNNNNFNSNNNNDNTFKQPQVFVSSLGEISTDPNRVYNPYASALVITGTFDTLPSNVDSVSASADSGQRLAPNGQFNQLNDNTQIKPFSSDNGAFNNRITLQQEINHLSVDPYTNEPPIQQNSFQNQQPTSYGSKDSTNVGATQNNGPTDQSTSTFTDVYSGSGDLLSQTINQYGENAQPSSLENGQNGRSPNLSALVNSLGETITSPVFTGEGNLLSQTIGQRENSLKPETGLQIQGAQSDSENVAKSAISTPQPLLQTPHYSEQSRITNVVSTHLPRTNGDEVNTKTNVVSPGEGNSYGQRASANQSPQQVNPSNIGGTVVYSGEGNLLSQTIGQRGSGSTATTQLDTNSFSSNSPSDGQGTASSSSQKYGQGSSFDYSLPKEKGSSPTVIPTSHPIQSGRIDQRVFDQSKQQSIGTSAVTQTTYNNRFSFGQNLSTKSSVTSTTAAPYSPSIPPFRSTTTSIYTPRATSNSQQSRNYQSQPSNAQQNNFLSQSFSNNQFLEPSKEYLPSTDNTRTARTNEYSFGNHGASALKSSSSQNSVSERFDGGQQDTRQQFTYPIDETDSKLLDNSNDLPYLGLDADTTKQNLTNRDVTHLNKYLYRDQVESTNNETTEQTVIKSERNGDSQLSSISITDIVDLNRILQENGKLEDITSDEISSAVEVNTTELPTSGINSLKHNPIVVPDNNDLSDDTDASDNMQDTEVLAKFDESANLLFKGLQLSLYEEMELSNSDIGNELNDDIYRSQDVYEEKIRNPKDVHSSGGESKQSNSIKLIFERAKNRSTDFRVKLKSKREQENKAKRTFALPQKTAEEKLVTILKPLLRNITVTPTKYLENNTKIGGFINNDLKFSLGEPRQRHSLAPRILFKNVKTIEDIERIATGIDTVEPEDDEFTSETRLSNRIVFPDSIKLRTINDSDKSTKDDSKMNVSSIEPSIELVNKDKDWSYYTKTMFFPQRNQPKPVTDHETASSDQQIYSSAYLPSQQYNPQPSSNVYNQYNSYPQYQQQQSVHYATIDNRPNPSHSTFQAPPLQSNYPTAIQNNPPSPNSYHSSTNYYTPSISSSVQSSIPTSLPTVTHPSIQNHHPSQPTNSFSSNQSPKTTFNEKVVVNIIPATGWYLNDANERQSFLDAVSTGLLSDKGYVYVNDVQSSQRQQPQQPQQPQSTGRSQIDIDEEAFFRGSSSYESPLNSVGKLPGDSDSVSGYLENQTSESSVGYQYQHPRRSFNV